MKLEVGVGVYALNLFFTKPLADTDVGDAVNISITATVSHHSKNDQFHEIFVTRLFSHPSAQAETFSKNCVHIIFYAPQAYIVELLNSCGFSYCPWFAGKNRFSGTNIFYWSLGTNSTE